MYHEQDGSLTFAFDCLPPSLNQTMRMHWSKRKAVKEYFAYLFMNGYNLSGATIAEPVEVSVTWRVMRRMDDDNAKARFKLIGDAMKAAGIVSDDNPDVLHLNEPKQEIVKHRVEQGFTVTAREYLPFTDEDDEPEQEPVPVRIQYVPTLECKVIR